MRRGDDRDSTRLRDGGSRSGPSGGEEREQLAEFDPEPIDVGETSGSSGPGDGTEFDGSGHGGDSGSSGGGDDGPDGAPTP